MASSTNLFGTAFKSIISAISYFQFHFGEDHGLHGITVPIKNRNNKSNITKSRPLSLQTVELKVRMCCSGCERVVKKSIYKLRGSGFGGGRGGDGESDGGRVRRKEQGAQGS
ncbi:Heavy metal-associated isoprenylated plant protein 30 [Linum perenne]